MKTQKHKRLPIQRKYKNMVLCGGGSKCIALCGALHFLQAYDLIGDLKQIIGTSAGALIGLLWTLGYSTKEIDSEIEHLNSHKIFGSRNNIMSFSITSLPQILYGLVYYNGINTGEAFFEYLKTIFTRKNLAYNITFNDLHKIHKIKFTAVATNLTSKNIKIFNVDDTPNVPVIHAVMASACIPFVFRPIKINGDQFVDGGLKNNFPVSLVPKKEPTIALRLESYDDHEEEYTQTSSGFLSFMSNILDVLFSNVWADERFIKRSHNVDIFKIFVPNINFIDFDLKSEVRQTLRNAGYDTLKREMLSF